MLTSITANAGVIRQAGTNQTDAALLELFKPSAEALPTAGFYLPCFGPRHVSERIFCSLGKRYSSNISARITD